MIEKKEAEEVFKFKNGLFLIESGEMRPI